MEAGEGTHTDAHLLDGEAGVAVGVNVDETAGGDGVGVERGDGLKGIGLGAKSVADAVELVGESEGQGGGGDHGRMAVL